MFFLLFLAALLAFSLSAVAGGMAGLLLIPILGWVLPLAQVPAAVSIGVGASSVSRIAVFRRDIRWDIVKFFVPTSLPTAVLGALLLRSLNPL